MAKRKFPLVTLWSLTSEPKRFRRLERESGGVVLLGDSERLEKKNVRLFVPSGIEVFRLLTRFYPSSEFVFSVVPGNDMNIAYASEIKNDDAGSLNFAVNAADLTKCPWYDMETTARMYNNIFKTYRDYSFRHAEGRHPLFS